MPQYAFVYRSVGAAEGKMLDDLAAVVRENNIDERAANRFTLAVSEAFTNALLHGNRRDPTKEIRIEIDVNEREIHADIRDEGRNGLARIAARRPPAITSENGRGIDLITHYAEQVRFDETPSGGLIVSLRFTRSTDKHEIEETSV
ncbi:MAG: ATP-binding protein [Candidatus Zixiibacteriota bacterium]|nr:MAG: ATP-binding protein [candidate division Zixibacteria bacterium]